MKLRDAPLMQIGVQIDKHVATTDQVDPRKWRIGAEVLPRECTNVPHILMDLVTTVAFDEKPLQSRGGDVLFNRAGINPKPRMFDHRVAKVSPENLDLQFGGLGPERFKNTNRQGINFFTGRATGDPRAQLRLSIFALIFEQAREETLLQCAVDRPVPEKAGHVNEQIVKERCGFFFAIAQKPRVLTNLFDPVQRHSSLNSPKQGAFLVGAEIDARLFF